jgi:tRNA threonylcarbamoyl adenosine modification protein YeaZ
VILAIDTALSATSACLIAAGDLKPLAMETLPMQSGQAEALLPLIDRIVSRAEGGFKAITRVAVTVGPGSFTGIRIGVAAARAIGLACKIPVVGVSTLAALAASGIAAGIRAPIVAAIDARHGNVYVQSFGADGATLLGPALMTAGEAARALGGGPVRLLGSGGPMIAIEAWSIGISAEADVQASIPDITFVARLGALADPARALPRPLYLKAPDATPPAATRLLRRPEAHE